MRIKGCKTHLSSAKRRNSDSLGGADRVRERCKRSDLLAALTCYVVEMLGLGLQSLCAVYIDG